MRELRSYELLDSVCNGGTLSADGVCCIEFASPIQENLAPARAIVLSTLGITVPFQREDR